MQRQRADEQHYRSGRTDIVIVDDGSTDGTADACEFIVGADQNVRIVPMLKPFESLTRLFSDWRACARLCADFGSVLGLGLDFALSRFLGIIPNCLRSGIRQVRLRGNVVLFYRLNKGDLHSLREVWFDEAYRLPFSEPSGTLLDLGANIGLTSVWLARNYPAINYIIALEPDPDNFRLCRQNLELNGLNAELIQAAIAPREGTAMFSQNESSNLGHLADHGLPVRTTTVDAILKGCSQCRFALVKIDIEGGEQHLFEGSLAWLDQTDGIIIELHPALVDCSKILKVVTNRGFTYIAANSVFRGNMDCFVRKSNADAVR